MKVITISGKAEAGKDLSACLLRDELEAKGKKVLIVHYADYLKFIAKEYFYWDGKKDQVGRELLQRLGTDVIRKRNPNFWVQVIALLINALEADYDYFLIPDCRFPNEVELMNIAFGFDVIALNVVRLNYENRLTPEQRLHPSETALDWFSFDYVIESESGEENLLVEVQKFISHYKL